MAPTANDVPVEQEIERVGREVAARPVYRGAMVVGLLALAGFIVIAALVVSGVSTAVDDGILAMLHQLATPPLVAAALSISMLGNEALVLLLPLSAALLWLRKLRWQAVEVVVATLGAQVANDVLKLVFHRDRPSGYSVLTAIPGQGYSFPSGHAMVSIAFYGALAYVGWRLLRGRQRTLWIALMAGIVVLIGLMRLILGAHYPTDVLASWAMGLIWLDVTLVGVGVLHQRRSQRRQPVADQPAPAP